MVEVGVPLYTRLGGTGKSKGLAATALAKRAAIMTENCIVALGGLELTLRNSLLEAGKKLGAMGWNIEV